MNTDSNLSAFPSYLFWLFGLNLPLCCVALNTTTQHSLLLLSTCYEQVFSTYLFKVGCIFSTQNFSVKKDASLAEFLSIFSSLWESWPYCKMYLLQLQIPSYGLDIYASRSICLSSILLWSKEMEGGNENISYSCLTFLSISTWIIKRKTGNRKHSFGHTITSSHGMVTCEQHSSFLQRQIKLTPEMINEEWAGVNYLTSNFLPVFKHKVMWPPGRFNFWSTFYGRPGRPAGLPYCWGQWRRAEPLTAPLQPTQTLNLALHFEIHKAPTVFHVTHTVSCAYNFTCPLPLLLLLLVKLSSECKEAFSVPVKKILSVSNCRIRHCFQWCRWLKGSFSAAFF